jgi:hypothetical protein
MPEPSEAHELRCASCGSAFQVTSLDEQVRCPFCGHTQDVDADLLARLDEYQGKVQDQRRATAGERLQAARYDVWYGRMRRGSPLTVAAVTLSFMILPTGVGLALWGLVTLMGEEAVGHLMPYVPIPLMGLVFLFLAGWTAWMYSGPRRRRSVAGLESVAMACPGCGAVNRIEPGEKTTSCAFCRASLVPSEPVMGRSLAEAQREKLAARLERYRTEREGVAKSYSYSIHGFAHWTVLGPFMLMTCGGSLAFSVEMALGREPFHPGIFLLWAMGFGCVSAGVGISLYQRSTRRRWHAAMAAVARGLDGEVLSGMDGLVGWLDRHWAGPYDLRFLFAGKYAHGASVTADGFAGLLWVEPTAASDQHPARAHVFLSAWIPGTADESDAPLPDGARAQLEELRREFDVQLQQGGLFVALDDVEVRSLRRNPASATELAPLFTRLAALARSMGASPTAG